MADFTKLFANVITAPAVKIDVLKTVAKIPTPNLQRLYQSTGDRYIAMHNGTISGNAEEYEMLGNAVEFFKQTLRTRDPGTGVQSEAMNKYLTELSGRIETVCGSFKARLAPNLTKATDISKYTEHASNDAFIAASAGKTPFVYATQARPTFPKFLTDNAELFKNKSESFMKKTEEFLAKHILDGLETEGFSINQITKALSDAKLPDAARLENYLKRVR